MKTMTWTKTFLALTAVSLLWGCGGGQSANPTSDQTTPPPAAEASSTAAPSEPPATSETASETPATDTETANETTESSEPTEPAAEEPASPPSEAPPSEGEAPPAEDAAALIEQGLALAGQCLACHSVDGAAGVGPSWLGLYGTTETLDDDSTVVVDEAYLIESITDPAAKIVKGYSNVMPPYAFGQAELDALVAYIRSLQGE